MFLLRLSLFQTALLKFEVSERSSITNMQVRDLSYNLISIQFESRKKITEKSKKKEKQAMAELCQA